MSIQAVAAVLDTHVGDAAAKLLLLSLANAHNGSTGMCQPSIERLAAESDLSRSSVKRKLAWLADAVANGKRAFIAVDNRFVTTGKQLANGYRLLILDQKEGVQAEPPAPQEGVHLLDPPGGSPAEPPKKKPEEIPEESISSARDALDPTAKIDGALAAIDAILDASAELEEVLDEDHAAAVLAHFAGLGKPLTGYTARLKAQQLDKFPDPNAAAEEMIFNGWHNLRPGWGDTPATKASETPSVSAGVSDRVPVNRDLQSRLWDACCRETGHSSHLVDRNGSWLFDATLVARLAVSADA
ncbi:MAG: helix-turn-helix domain-containing protein [Devosia sp.]